MDVRSHVFDVVSSILVDQFNKGMLFAVIEMVPGILDRMPGANESHWDCG